MAQSALRALTQQLMQGGPAPSGMASYQTAVQNAANRPQASADMLAGLPFSKEQAAYLAAQFAPGAAMADASGMMPSMPEKGQGLMSTAQSGQFNPSIRQNLQQGNYLDAALQGLGAVGDAAYAIPLAGLTVGNVLKAPRAIDKALDMSQAARMQRAQEQVYTPNLYHGTAADIEEFNPAQFGGSATKARSAKLGTWMVDNPEVAGGYARFAAEDVPVQRLLDQAMRAERNGNFNEADRLNVLAENLELGGDLRGGGGQNIMPLRARGKFFEIDAEGATMSDLDDNQLTDWAQEAKAKGFDGIKINNFSDNVDYGQYMPATHYLVFDPANIRSANAAFDPTKQGSANLMAGIMGGAVGLSALRQLMPQQEQE